MTRQAVPYGGGTRHASLTYKRTEPEPASAGSGSVSFIGSRSICVYAERFKRQAADFPVYNPYKMHYDKKNAK